MIRHTTKLMTLAILLLSGSAVIAFQDAPPPDLPPGHPPLPTEPTSQAPAPTTADMNDVGTAEAIVAAYYDSISGPKGEPRNWDRFRSLFMPGAKLMTMRPAGAGSVPAILAPEDYITANDTYFTNGGYFETELNQHADVYGRIAQVFSTYGSQRRIDAPKPYSRGINSFQLMHDGARWWIVSMMWDHERPTDNPLPPQYLPGG